MLEPAELKVIDEWRFRNRMPSRAAAIRELLRMGIQATMETLAELPDPTELPEVPKSDSISVTNFDKEPKV